MGNEVDGCWGGGVVGVVLWIEFKVVEGGGLLRWEGVWVE